MKRSGNLLFFVLLLNSARAQNDIQKCAEEKNKVLVDIINTGKQKDNAALKKLNDLNKEWQNCVIGKEIPALDVQTLSGEKISTENLKGSLIVVNFWFTTCPPCIAEMPEFNHLVREYKNRSVVFIGFTYNDKKTVREFLNKTRFDFKIIPEADEVEELFGVLAHPTTFVVDKVGKLSLAVEGGSSDNETYFKIKTIIDKLLKDEQN